MRDLIKSRAIVVGLIIGAIAALGAGCGSSSQASATLTKAEFMQKAEAICSRFELERLAAIKSFILLHKGKVGTQALQEAIVEEAALPPIKAGVEKIAALGTPKQETAKAETFVKAYQEAVSRIAGDANYALKGDPFAAVRKVSHELGFKKCGQI